jgi:beta-mannosidase
MFYPRLTNPSYKPGYTHASLINDAVESHFNMLRVWGGGQYESSEFLELASLKGIMIFYDFMFSDTIYPSHREMLDSIELEVTQQVRRARNYPCVVLWNGNNEIQQGMRTRGWANKDEYLRDY